MKFHNSHWNTRMHGNKFHYFDNSEKKRNSVILEARKAKEYANLKILNFCKRLLLVEDTRRTGTIFFACWSNRFLAHEKSIKFINTQCICQLLKVFAFSHTLLIRWPTECFFPLLLVFASFVFGVDFFNDKFENYHFEPKVLIEWNFKTYLCIWCELFSFDYGRIHTKREHRLTVSISIEHCRTENLFFEDHFSNFHYLNFEDSNVWTKHDISIFRIE